jgi:hypothetical protein
MTRKIVLVSGMAHSGTTILQRALKHHPNINGPVPETSFLVGKRRDSIINEVNLLMDQYSSYPIVIEKTPLHLWFFENLLEAVPSAQMLVILRDGKDVVASQQERLGRFYSINRGADHWSSSAQKALSLALKYPDNVKIVRYELLVRNFNHTIQDILTFIQLNANEYDYSAITKSSTDSYLSESTEIPAFEDISYQSASGLKGTDFSTEKFTRDSGYIALTKPQIDDEINILPYRKLQVASPLFDGTGKAKYLSVRDKLLLQRNIIFSTMMNFMGYTIQV